MTIIFRCYRQPQPQSAPSHPITNPPSTHVDTKTWRSHHRDSRWSASRGPKFFIDGDGWPPLDRGDVCGEGRASRKPLYRGLCYLKVHVIVMNNKKTYAKSIWVKEMSHKITITQFTIDNHHHPATQPPRDALHLGLESNNMKWPSPPAATPTFESFHSTQTCHFNCCWEYSGQKDQSGQRNGRKSDGKEENRR